MPWGNGAEAERKCPNRDASQHSGTSPTTVPSTIHEWNLKLKVPAANTVVTTSVRLLSGHTFTAGEYTARFCPLGRSFDPHPQYLDGLRERSIFYTISLMIRA